MEMFALDEEVARWEDLLPSSIGRARLLVQEAQLLMLEIHLPTAVACQYQARINLTCGEIHWFYGELELAEVLAKKALSEFTKLADAKG